MAVHLAASSDKERPVLYRSVLVEQHDAGVMLVAADSYWLAMSWVPFDDPYQPMPLLEDVPVATSVIADVDFRVRDLMSFVAAATKKADAADIEVSLTPASDYDPETPTLDPDLAAPHVSVSIATERVTVRRSEVGYPTWRALMTAQVGKVAAISFAPWVMARLGKVASTIGALGVDLEFRTKKSGALWTATTDDLTVSGIVMPLGQGGDE
jgi:hypothetical protein